MTPLFAAASRRRFLRGAGVCLALPWLESLVPREQPAAASGSGLTSSGAPLRMGFVYVPNGAQQQHWFPTGAGTDFQFGPTMEPLETVKSSIQVISGLDHANAESGPDGAGDHARANATFLTGARARKSASADIFVGESIDQLAARHIGEQTRFESLELSCDAAIRKSGICDSGYSCAYQYNLSWRTPTSPMAPESNPALVFERLFGGDDDRSGLAREQRLQERSSLLDFIGDDARLLQRQLSTQDRRKLDEYLTGVRELELRLERSRRLPVPARPSMQVPEDIPEDYGEHMDLMFDLMFAAFNTDSTRIVTFMLAHDGSNRSFPELEIQEGHHSLTHEQEKEEACEKVAKIDRYYMRRFAGFLEKLRDAEDCDGHSLLHNSMIVYGSGIADANRHTHSNLPLILAGNGGGSLESGKYLQTPGLPVSNLYLSLLDRMGIEGVERFGDSSGRLTGI